MMSGRVWTIRLIILAALIGGLLDFTAAFFTFLGLALGYVMAERTLHSPPPREDGLYKRAKDWGDRDDD